MRKVIMRTTLILAVLFLVGACEKEVVDTVSIEPDQVTAVQPRVTSTCDACTDGDVIFGPYYFTRYEGKPEWATQTFPVDAEGEVCLQISSLTASAAWIELNGMQIFAPSNFNGTAAALNYTTILPAGDHTLTIKVAGAVGTVVNATVRACSIGPPPPLCSERARALCEGFGYQVVESYPGEGLLYCTDGRPAINNCDNCALYQIMVWKDGAREQYCDSYTGPYSTQAGGVYAGHMPCQCGDNLQYCGTWDMQGCIPD